ncbi:hypothetical protein BJ742DRAFT_898538 [Cladochytrium replicatum]|nr:hypothetical protein BJ742DRAFT_898538 [Cladochytrium replicatum]
MPLRTAAGARPIATGIGGGDSGVGPRPMTSVRGAGFSSRGRAARSTTSAQDRTLESQPEEQIKLLERKVSALIEESAILAADPSTLHLALEKAKEAGKKERQLSKHREQAQLGDQVNLDLTYCVLFNLANQYHANKMYQEALNSYAVIVKNKLFNQSGRLRVNMGNIYFEQKKYSQAVKMYRMALDQIPNTNKEIRLKIMRNIGNTFVRMGQFQDAITSFEAIMENQADFHTGFNLLLCYFALGDRERMKNGFQKLVSIRPPAVEQFEDALTSNVTHRMAAASAKATLSSAGAIRPSDETIEDHEVFNEDNLRAIARERKKSSERYILLAAKLIAPNIGTSFSNGYDWIVETIKASPHADIASELEIAKAIQFLKTRDFAKAIETLKAFEKKDEKLIGTAATNLAFLYFLEGEYKQAEKYAEVAITHDRYNAKAQTNRGNCLFVKGKFVFSIRLGSFTNNYSAQYDKAREHYLEAVGVDALCTEAMYNLGLVNKRLCKYVDALQWFDKLHSILRNSSEVIYQIADIYEQMGNSSQALEWFNILLSVVPTDPGVLAKLGDMCARDGDRSQAFQYYSESYRYFPSNMYVISWLGAYYVDCEVYEQAVQFFERASMIDPTTVRWQLMIASCHQRSGNYQLAFDTYKNNHDRFPDNVECLRFLVRICTDLGMKEVHEYIAKLSRAEKAKESKGGEDLKRIVLEEDDTPEDLTNLLPD